MESSNGLNITISLNTAPAVHFGALLKPESSGAQDSLTLNVSATIKHEALGRLLTDFLRGKKITVSEGFIPAYVVIKNVTTAVDANGNLLVHVAFSGSFSGTVYFRGKPFYDPATSTLKFESLAYQLDTKSLILLAAKAIFQKRIATLLQQHAAFALNPVYQKIKEAVLPALNKEWAAGIQAQGSIEEIKIMEVAALPEGLLIQATGTGRLRITIQNTTL